MTERPEPHGDLTLLVPERLLTAYDRRRAAWSGIDTVAAWLVAAHLLLLLVIVGRGSFYMDDLRAQGYALDQPFLSFIVGSNGTHFAPVPRILDWTQSRLAPLEHGPAVAITLLVRLLLALGFWRVLRRLFGARPATLVPFTMLLLTPALIPATTYYRQSITVVACAATLVWALDAYLRWVLYRHRGDLIALALITALGLGCYEKAAMIPVILLALTPALFLSVRPGVAPADGDRPVPGDRPGTVRAGLIAVAVTGVVVLLFLVIYRSGPYQQAGGALPSVTDVLRLLRDTVVKTLVPLLLGGPYRWGYPGAYVGVPQLSGVAQAFSVVIVLVGVALTGWRNPGRTARALLLLVAWTVPSVVIIAVGRFNELGFGLGTAVRLWADLVPGFLLAGALAALPWQVGVHRETATARPAPAPAEDGTPAPLEISTGVLAATLVVVLVLAGSVFSSLTYASKWWDNPTGLWIANARSTLENAEPYPRTLATPMPPGVIPTFVSLVFPTNAPLLLLLRPDLRFHDGDGPTKVMNPAGVRSAYTPKVLTEVKPKAPNYCSVALPPGNTPVPVKFPTVAPYVSGAQIQVGMLLAEATTVDVTMTTPDGQVLTPVRYSHDVLQKGGRTLRVPVPFLKSVSSISVKITGTKISCITSAQVWVPQT